ncbi:MAG: trypsin-like peptidase domain-containing protein [Bacteroidota bacterium]
MKKIGLYIIAGMLGGIFALGGFLLIVPQQAQQVSAIESPDFGKMVNQMPKNLKMLGDAPADFTKAAKIGMPAVVHIHARQTGTTTNNREDRSMDLFREFFGDDFSPFGQMPMEGSGSGVIISKDGYIVTNNHVVEYADEVSVTLFDKRKFKANIIGTDPTTDLAVLKIEGHGMPTLKFSDSDRTKVGQWVMAVGNPFDLTSTVTAGIISAKGRSIDILGGGAAIESFIQTDAAVNPGNSGGALIDLEGNLVGINTAIMTRTGRFAGYSFAVPSNIVSKVVEDLMEYGSIQRGFIGINIRDLDADTASDLGLNITEGVHVISLVDDGAAIKAGLLPDDVIIAVNGKDVKSAPELQELVGRLRPGDEVQLDVNRLGEQKSFNVRLKK